MMPPFRHMRVSQAALLWWFILISIHERVDSRRLNRYTPNSAKVDSKLIARKTANDASNISRKNSMLQEFIDGKKQLRVSGTIDTNIEMAKGTTGQKRRSLTSSKRRVYSRPNISNSLRRRPKAIKSAALLRERQRLGRYSAGRNFNPRNSIRRRIECNNSRHLRLLRKNPRVIEARRYVKEQNFDTKMIREFAKTLLNEILTEDVNPTRSRKYEKTKALQISKEKSSKNLARQILTNSGKQRNDQTSNHQSNHSYFCEKIPDSKRVLLVIASFFFSVSIALIALKIAKLLKERRVLKRIAQKNAKNYRTLKDYHDYEDDGPDRYYKDGYYQINHKNIANYRQKLNPDAEINCASAKTERNKLNVTLPTETRGLDTPLLVLNNSDISSPANNPTNINVEKSEINSTNSDDSIVSDVYHLKKCSDANMCDLANKKCKKCGATAAAHEHAGTGKKKLKK